MKGHTQRQIAEILKIALVTVNEDLKYLRLQAKQNISRYIDEYLPAEYENCLDGLNSILVQAWAMSSDAESDRRERTQALVLAKECYAMKLIYYHLLQWLIGPSSLLRGTGIGV